MKMDKKKYQFQERRVWTVWYESHQNNDFINIGISSKNLML